MPLAMRGACVGHPAAGALTADWGELEDKLGPALFALWREVRWPGPLDKLAALPTAEAQADWLWRRAEALGLATATQVAQQRHRLQTMPRKFPAASYVETWRPAVAAVIDDDAAAPEDYGGGDDDTFVDDEALAARVFAGQATHRPFAALAGRRLVPGLLADSGFAGCLAALAGQPGRLEQILRREAPTSVESDGGVPQPGRWVARFWLGGVWVETEVPGRLPELPGGRPAYTTVPSGAAVGRPLGLIEAAWAAVHGSFHLAAARFGAGAPAGPAELLRALTGAPVEQLHGAREVDPHASDATESTAALDGFWARLETAVAKEQLVVATCPPALQDHDHGECVYAVVGTSPATGSGDRMVQLRQWWVGEADAGQWAWNHTPHEAERRVNKASRAADADATAAAAAAAAAADADADELCSDDEAEAEAEAEADAEAEAEAESEPGGNLLWQRLRVKMAIMRKATEPAAAMLWMEVGCLAATFHRVLLVPTTAGWRASHAAATVELRCPESERPFADVAGQPGEHILQPIFLASHWD
jgi:hypothetical protein